MVAYSFKKQFASAVEQGAKNQTIRAPRKRHANPGEPVQLYTGMRTKQCRKLCDPDTVCQAVFRVDIRAFMDIEIDGIQLTDSQIRNFAIADGFKDDCSGPAVVNAETQFMEFFKPRFPCMGYQLIYWGPADWWNTLANFLPDLVIQNHDRL